MIALRASIFGEYTRLSFVKVSLIGDEDPAFTFCFEMVLITLGFLYTTELDDGRFIFESDLVETDFLVDVFSIIER